MQLRQVHSWERSSWSSERSGDNVLFENCPLCLGDAKQYGFILRPEDLLPIVDVPNQALGLRQSIAGRQSDAECLKAFPSPLGTANEARCSNWDSWHSVRPRLPFSSLRSASAAA